MTDGELDSQDSFRGFHNDGVSRFNEPGIVGWCLPALMYLTCPAMHTTRLPSGRPSTSCLRLRSYSDAGIPGVISPGLTTRAQSALLSATKNGGSGDVRAARSPRWVWDFEVG